MTYQRPTDPEILADLRHREASERDRTRTGEPAHGIVEHWPCALCGAMVGVGQIALDVRDSMNRELERRRQSPLPKRAKCDACTKREAEEREAKRRPHEQTEMAIDNPNRRRSP